MEHTNDKTKKERMSAEEVALFLSNTMRDVAARKVTLRYAMAVSRLALALSKTIETVELKDRVALLEQVLGRKKSR